MSWESFGNFSTVEKGFKGYIDLLKTNFPNAHEALTNNNKTVDDFIGGLMKGTKGSYATGLTYAEDFKQMFIGVVKDYENSFKNRLTEIDNRIKEIVNELKETGLNDDQLDSIEKESSILLNEKSSINSQIILLNKFKKNEGLD